MWKRSYSIFFDYVICGRSLVQKLKAWDITFYYKEDSTIQSNKFRYPRPSNSEQIQLFFQSRTLYRAKHWNAKYNYWLQRDVKIKLRVPILWMFLFSIFSLCFSQYHLKNAKYRFWLQKEVENPIPWNFLIRDPGIMGSFIWYFCFMTILSTQKLRNAKYRFWLQKGVKIQSNEIFWFATSNSMLFHASFFSKSFSKNNWKIWITHMLSIITFQRIYWNVTSFSLTVMRRKFKTRNYSIRLQKEVKKQCEQLLWNQNQKLREILFYNFVSNINHMFRSDVTVLTLFSSEIV